MIYLIADLHLNHRNIIRYCNRPFDSVEEMNRTIIDNWNRVVNDDDLVYVVGDLAFGKDKTQHWVDKLKGNVFLILGNHDRGVINIPHAEKLILEYKGYEFLLVHNPHGVDNWSGWRISGHTHNNDTKNYPFINPDKKTINVGIELTGYMPVSLDFLVSKIREGVGFCERIV